MITQIFFFIFSFYVLSSYCQDYSSDKEDYISIESGETPEVNEIESKYYFDKLDDDTTSTSRSSIKTTTDVVLPNNDTSTTGVVEIETKYDSSKRATNTILTTTVEEVVVPRVTVNTTAPYTCGDKRNSDSSEEDRCRIRLLNYPFSVSVQKKGAHYASGALISAQRVLTVAADFFFVRESIKLYKVRLGSVDCKRGGVLLPIKSMHIHPSFTMGKPAFDLAVLVLSSPVNVTTYIKPISLSQVKQKVVSAKFMTTYWPRLIVNGEILPTTAKERVKQHSMRVSTQRLIPWKKCYNLLKTRGEKLDETSLCLKPITTHHSICMPDVGAPVVADDGLWGITSGWTSEYCKLFPSPTVFTRLSTRIVQRWLKEMS